MKKRICFVLGSDYNYLGGLSIYQKNIFGELRKNFPGKFDIDCIFPGKKDKEWIDLDIKFISLETRLPYPLSFFEYAKKVSKIVENNNYEIVNSHAMGGYFLKKIKNKNFKSVHTYHGVTYFFLKNHQSRLNLLKKMILRPVLKMVRRLEEPPYRNSEKIICVSEKVKEDLEKLYGNRKGIKVIRTGTDIKEFKPGDKLKARRLINLDVKSTYGLYMGRGGYWTKGLDRAISLAEEIYKKNNSFRLIVCGADEDKVSLLLNKPFIIYRGTVDREEIRNYYLATDIFFCLSRYEGGAPTMVTGEAMSSGCFVVCSNDSEQEIILDGKNGIIIERFDNTSADKILKVLNNSKKLEAIKKNARKTMENLSLEKWGRDYLKTFFEK
ncbi:D-inositol-3-phosphate glycosyltransferase [uncultured archaeon]|nr:D-inositol-3-phosphate glycosyltransferase [uncultured archaeon]